MGAVGHIFSGHECKRDARPGTGAFPDGRPGGRRGRMADRALRLQEAFIPTLDEYGSREVLTPLLSQRQADPDFLYLAPSTVACAAFSEESRMRLANANKVHRKSGGSAFTE